MLCYLLTIIVSYHCCWRPTSHSCDRENEQAIQRYFKISTIIGFKVFTSFFRILSNIKIFKDLLNHEYFIQIFFNQQWLLHRCTDFVTFSQHRISVEQLTRAEREIIRLDDKIERIKQVCCCCSVLLGHSLGSFQIFKCVLFHFIRQFLFIVVI